MKHVYDIKIGSIRRIQETGNCRILQPRYRLESPGRQCAECTGEFPGFFLTPDRRQRLAALYEFQCIEATDRKGMFLQIISPMRLNIGTLEQIGIT